MELREYISLLWRRKWVIFLTLCATMVIVLVGTRLITPTYEATTVLRIATSSGGSLNYQEYMYADRLMNTYIEMATRTPVLEELVDRLALGSPPKITAEIIPNTELIKITVEYTDAKLAAESANTLADILLAQGNQLYIGGGKMLSEVLNEQLTQIQADLDATRQDYEKLSLQIPPDLEAIDTARQVLQLKQSNYATLLTQYQQARFREEIQSSMITVFEKATLPTSPSKPRVLLNMALGLLMGLLGGLGLAFIFENLDTTLYSTEQIEDATKLMAWAKIPKAKKDQLFRFQDGFSSVTEAFRNLAMNMEQGDHRRMLKVFLIMSAETHQGKSLIVSQLAGALAEFGKNVVAVDCDLRRPKLHSYFGLSNQCGLTDVLERYADLEAALQKSSYPGVWVLPSGSLPSHTSKLLGSPQMSELINSLRLKFDYVLLDTPALLGMSDVASLVQKTGRILWVVRRTYAKRPALETARRFLAGTTDKSISLIVNQAEENGSYDYYFDPRRQVVSIASDDERIDREAIEVVGKKKK